MATTSRMIVPPPVKDLLEYGLFSVAEIRPEPVDPATGRVNPHWKAGVTWQNVCPDADRTYDECVSENAGTGDIAAPASKAATAVRSTWGATPFTVYVEVDCSAPGFLDDVKGIISKTFTEAEQWEVERGFSTGRVGSTAGVIYPHLQHNTSVTDADGITLQLAVTSIGPTGNVPLDIVEAMGKMEQSLSACVKGVGVIHVPAELLPHLVAQRLVEEEDGIYYSCSGHKIAVSSAYQGLAPNNTTTTNALWIYGTGPVFIYRDSGKFLGGPEQMLDRSVNTVKGIFERTYVVGYDCCLLGVPVSTGGVIAGTAGSAT